MRVFSLAITLCSLLLFDCTNTTKDKSKDQTELHKKSPKDEVIILDNGEKWKVDANMLVAIRNMENDVNSMAKSDPKDYKELVNKLQSNLDLLISSCTMKGKSHDELHKWLLPYKATVEELAETKDNAEAAKLFEKIQTSLKDFNQYFQ